MNNEKEPIDLIISIPFGMWDLDGNWYPNRNLSMSEEAQWRHNVDHGFIMHEVPSKRIAVLCSDRNNGSPSRVTSNTGISRIKKYLSCLLAKMRRVSISS